MISDIRNHATKQILDDQEIDYGAGMKTLESQHLEQIQHIGHKQVDDCALDGMQ